MAVPNGLVEALFDTPLPYKVWHYTSLAGFKGILSSGSIWATEAHSTTDKSEFVHAQCIATTFLETYPSQDEHYKSAKDAALKIVQHAFENGVLSPQESEIYVVSFSATMDLKSQWEKFGDGGNGVSLAFDLSNVRPSTAIDEALRSKSAITVAPCVYAQCEKEKLLECALSHFIEVAASLHRQTGDPKWAAEQMRCKEIMTLYMLDRKAFEKNLQKNSSEQLQKANEQTLFDLIRLASHCKDPSFDQEKEWRLALPRLKSKPLQFGKIEFRGPQGNIPYIASKLFQSNGRLPITEVMLGPSCDGHIQVFEALKSYGYSVPISKSIVSRQNH